MLNINPPRHSPLESLSTPPADASPELSKAPSVFTLSHPDGGASHLTYFSTFFFISRLMNLSYADWISQLEPDGGDKVEIITLFIGNYLFVPTFP
ncbi:hypothetical protein Scep_001123 [Stephania cephalantha]|uniref:Uncharacterized protein n=1 Tax=Stephania cephalantha TaxID=152367 RepID=A0AAP0L8V6_9MAGN